MLMTINHKSPTLLSPIYTITNYKTLLNHHTPLGLISMQTFNHSLDNVHTDYVLCKF